MQGLTNLFYTSFSFSTCMRVINDVYGALLNLYGPQGWWPVTTSKGKKPAYFVPVRSGKQKLGVMVGAILTQNTSWKNVEKAIGNLHRHGIIDLKSLQAVKESRLASLIRSAGYYNQKAKKLKHLASFLNT